MALKNIENKRNEFEKGFNLRQNGDYEVESIITEEDAKEMVQKVKEFLEAAKKYLRNKK